MRIVVTGATGTVGTIVSAALGRIGDVVRVDRDARGDPAVLAADLATPAGAMALCDACAGAQVLVHLAAAVMRRPWREQWRDNVVGLARTVDAGRRARVPRLVYASSRQVVAGLERLMRPACYRPAGPKIGSVPPLPRNTYGCTKAFGEAAGLAYALAGAFDCVIAIRLAWVSPAPPPAPPPPRRPSAGWISHDDIASLFVAACTAPVRGFRVVNGTSAQPESPLALAAGTRVLGWRPSGERL